MREYFEKLNKFRNNQEVKILDNYPQHCCTTRLNHCNDVAVYSYRLANALCINVDERSLRTGAMLHDYYLYNTDGEEISTIKHWLHHPEIAMETADRVFDLNEKEKNIIKTHMWPLNPLHMPNCKEGWLVCIADKYCTLREVIGMRVFKKSLRCAS